MIKRPIEFLNDVNIPRERLCWVERVLLSRRFLNFDVKTFRCLDIFTPEEQSILRKYRKENFAEKKLVYSERRAIGKCPLTPEEVITLFHINFGWQQNEC